MDGTARNLTLNIKIPEGYGVQFNQEATFENFIGQFQSFCNKLLCIINGTILHYYDKTGPFPTNLRYDYKQRRGVLTEYYFRSIEDDTLYCVFGRDSAKILYPRIDDVDPSGVHEAFDKSDKSFSNNIFNPKASSQKIPEQKILNRKDPKLLKCTETKAVITSRNTEMISTSSTSDITIIDKGIRLSFSSPNYPIEIKTFYS